MSTVLKVREVYPAFVVISLDVSPQPADIGEEITITAQIANAGNTKGTYTTILLVNGVEVGKKDVAIPPEAIEPVAFKIVRDAAATYEAQVGNMYIPVKVQKVEKSVSGVDIPQGTRVRRESTYDGLVMWTPGIINYRANFLIPYFVEEAEVTFSGCEFAPRIRYRDHIETKAGQIRYNMFQVKLTDKSLASLDRQYTETALLHYSIKLAGTVPGIEVKNFESLLMGFGSYRLLNFMIEISPQVKPGDYTLRFIIEANGQNCGELPCVIHVIE
jgi:hypothetical protein